MRSLHCAALSLSVLLGAFAGCAPAPSRAPDTGTTLTAEDFRDPNEPIESVIQRKVPGVLVTRTGDGGIALQLRGVSSYKGDETPPLFMLNGLPFQPGPGGALTGINPHDIASIKVLKGAQAGIYGIEGANGVIVITTKQAGKPSP
jgi:TonB-dependent SusC/RagA subfamily outer membrane receptor